jgi:hypothetical protein
MTVINTVYITGCKERWGPFVIVDVDEPEKVGQSFNGGPPFCYEDDNHLGKDVELESAPLHRIYKDQEGRKTAGVKITCHETTCPMHKDFLLTPSGPDTGGKESAS